HSAPPLLIGFWTRLIRPNQVFRGHRSAFASAPPVVRIILRERGADVAAARQGDAPQSRSPERPRRGAGFPSGKAALAEPELWQSGPTIAARTRRLSVILASLVESNCVEVPTVRAYPSKYASRLCV